MVFSGIKCWTRIGKEKEILKRSEMELKWDPAASFRISFHFGIGDITTTLWLNYLYLITYIEKYIHLIASILHLNYISWKTYNANQRSHNDLLPPCTKAMSLFNEGCFGWNRSLQIFQNKEREERLGPVLVGKCFAGYHDGSIVTVWFSFQA